MILKLVAFGFNELKNWGFRKQALFIVGLLINILKAAATAIYMLTGKGVALIGVE